MYFSNYLLGGYSAHYQESGKSLLFADSAVLHLEDFLKWFGTVPEEELKLALDFRVLHIDAGSTA